MVQEAEAEVLQQCQSIECFDIIIRSLKGFGNLTKEIFVNGTPVSAVVDTGATVSLISYHTYEVINNPPGVEKTVKMKTASEGLVFTGSLLEPVVIKIDSIELKWKLYVAPITDSMLLGLDILKNTNANIDCSLEKVQVKGPDSRQESQSVTQDKDLSAEIAITLDSPIKIAPLSETIVTLSQKPRQKGEWYLEPNIDLPVAIARSVHSNSGVITLSIINLEDHHITLPVKTLVGTLFLIESPVTYQVRQVSVSPLKAGDFSHIQEMCEAAQKNMRNNGISELHQKKFVSIMQKYANVFAKNDMDLGNFTAIQHHINTGQANPKVTKMRRVPLHFAAEEEKHLQDMLKADVIQPSNSAWASAPVLIRKKDGTLRWCIDYRQVNAVTVKDTYPLPFLSECLDSLDGNSWYSKLDANSAYWQVPVAENSQEKTAFRTKFGLYEFKKLPFGLTNSPATFGRVMALVLRGLTWEAALAFLDDILVIGRTIEEHLKNLDLVLGRFHHFQLKLKPRKCEFFTTTVEFLGRMVNSEGTTLTESSKETMERWQIPKSIRDVQRLVGFVNYHRNYIPYLSELEEPLQEVLRTKKFLWGDKQQEAFNIIKEKVISPAVLAIPTKSGRFVLETDASDYSIGAELLQVQDNVERTISFGSFTLKASQRNYCTTKRELLSIVRFVDVYRHYLLGKEFTIRTDHMSLVWLMNFKKPDGILSRWLEELSRFHFIIEHRPGAHHMNADALSRCLARSGCEWLPNLPCKGCVKCQRLQARWRDFEERVDYAGDLGDPQTRQVGPRTQNTSIEVNVPRIRATQPEPPIAEKLDNYCQELSKDKELKFLYEYLFHRIEPDPVEVKLSSPAARFYWTNKDLFFSSKGCIYMGSAESTDLLVIPKSLQAEVMRLAHDIPCAAHQGISRTKAKITSSLFWYQMSKDIKRYVRGCSVCNQNKKANKKNKVPLTLNPSGYPMDKVHIDFVGPLKKTSQGNEHIMVVICAFSKWVELFPLPSQSAELTAQVLVKDVFARLGYPMKIITDQGKNFEAALFKKMCQMLQIHKLRTTPYHPSSNGMVERQNRILVAAIRSFINKNLDDWDIYVPMIASAMRAAVNSQTGYSANQLMLGREVLSPLDMSLPMLEKEEKHVEEYLTQLLETLEKAQDFARDVMKSKLKKMKKDYDASCFQQNFKEGDAVYILVKESKKHKKLRKVWKGPAVILLRLSPAVFRVKVHNNQIKVVNHDHLKLCTDTDLPVWIERTRRAIEEGTTMINCKCGQPDDHHPVMIQCENCLSWYHTPCVNLTREQAAALKTFICPTCS